MGLPLLIIKKFFGGIGKIKFLIVWRISWQYFAENRIRITTERLKLTKLTLKCLKVPDTDASPRLLKLQDSG